MYASSGTANGTTSCNVRRTGARPCQARTASCTATGSHHTPSKTTGLQSAFTPERRVQDTYHKCRRFVATVVLPVFLHPEQARLHLRRERCSHLRQKGDHGAETLHHVLIKVLRVVRQHDLVLAHMRQKLTSFFCPFHRGSDLFGFRQDILFALIPRPLEDILTGLSAYVTPTTTKAVTLTFPFFVLCL